MQYEISRMKEWIYAWCDFVSEWKKDMVIEQERAMWLSYYGIPFNLWSSLTFKNIGKLWGQVIGIDNDTLQMTSLQCGKVRIATKVMEPINMVIMLTCKDKFYLVRICEEQVIIVNAESRADPPKGEGSSYCNGVTTSCDDNGKCCRKSENGKEDDDEVEVELAAEVDIEAELAPVGRGSTMNEVERQANGIDDITVSRVIETGSGLGIGDIGGACMEMERCLSDFQIQGANEGSCQVVDHVDSMGYLKSLSGSELQRPSINLEVVIGPAQDNGFFNEVGGGRVNHAKSNGLGLVENAIVSKERSGHSEYSKVKN
ncbi:hypothetical protein ACSBR2_009119 [Camellia fascicularis]